MHSAGRFNGEQTYQLAIYSYISCKFHVNMIKCGLPTNTTQIKHNKVRIPTGGRLTSWLFTRRGGVEFGTTEDKSIQWQGGGLEPGTSGIQVQRPTTRPSLPPKNASKPVAKHFNLPNHAKQHMATNRHS